MSELRPILGDDPTDDEKRLLGSARLDVPPRAARRRTLAAMSLAAAVTTTAGTGGAAAATASAGLIVKWTALSALGGALVLGAAGSLTPLMGLAHRPPAIAPRPAPAASHGDRLRPEASFPSRVDPEEAQPAHSDLQAQPAYPDVQAQRDPTPPVPVTPSTPGRVWERRVEPRPSADLPGSPAVLPRDRATLPVADDTLAAEVAALDEARRALAVRDPAHALLSLDAYDHRFELRRLGPEAAVLRIEALIAEGRFGQAHQLGEQLLAAEPEGAHAQHVRSLLSGAAP